MMELFLAVGLYVFAGLWQWNIIPICCQWCRIGFQAFPVS